MKRILIVDQQQNVLEHFREVLRPLQDQLDVQFVSSSNEALAILDAASYDVVISDATMAGSDGTLLLSRIVSAHPHVLRIAMIDAGDHGTLVRSAGAGEAHQYLPKTAGRDDVLAIIGHTRAVRDLLADQSLRTLVSGLQRLPSLPAVYRELGDELGREEASIDRVARIMSKDMSMVMKILQIINSPFYGLLGNISSVPHAIALLGLDTIKALVLFTKVFSQFEGTKDSVFSLDMLWRHSTMTGRYAQMLAKNENARATVMDDALTGGLLHDIGLLVFAMNRPTEYRRTLELMHDRGIPDWEAERDVLGSTHAEVGAYLIGMWGLSDGVVEAVAFHHAPRLAPGHGFSALTAVHVANCFDEGEQAAGSAMKAAGPDAQYLRDRGLAVRAPAWRALCQVLSKGRRHLMVTCFLALIAARCIACAGSL